MFETANVVSKRSGKNKMAVLVDVIWCGLRYGAGYNDYKLCKFEELSGKQRKTYVTRGINNRLVNRLNDKDYFDIFDSKVKFNKTFNKFVKRDWIDLRQSNLDEFKKFLSGKQYVMAKVLDGMCGKGITKINVSDYESEEKLYNDLLSNGQVLVEDYVLQHDEMMKMYPKSVNTLRIVTVTHKGKTSVVYAFNRIGNGGVVDNINSGGMCAPIDVESGVISFPGYDKNENAYYEHPMTGTKIVGFKIPFWKESVDMCKEASSVVKEINYVGWDVCVTNDGPLLIEGNPYPGHDILQLPIHMTSEKIGMLPTFKKILHDVNF